MSRYDGFRNLATRLIERNGRALSLQIVPDPQSSDPDKPWKVQAAEPTTVNAVGVVFPIMHKKIDGTVVQVKDQSCFVSAQAIGDLVLTTQDTIVDSFDGKTYAIKDVEDISPGAQKVLYILQLRGA